MSENPDVPRPRILKVSRRVYAFLGELDGYQHVFILFRRKSGYRLQIWRVHQGDVERVFEYSFEEAISRDLEQALRESGDDVLARNVMLVQVWVDDAIEHWKDLYMKSYVLQLLHSLHSPRNDTLLNPLNPSAMPTMNIGVYIGSSDKFSSTSPSISHSQSLYVGDHSGGSEASGGLKTGWTAIKEQKPINSLLGFIHGTGTVDIPFRSGGHLQVRRVLDLHSMIDFVKDTLGEEIAEALEIVLTVSLSLKLTIRNPDQRPLWILIVGQPSSLKSAVLRFLEMSENVVMIEDITAAGILPAKDEVPSMLPYMNRKVTILPTLSLIASQDKQSARRLFAFLESVYDGRIFRKTGLGDVKGGRVDTVVIGAITNEVYDEFSDIMITYGSRFLVYPHRVDESRFVEVYERLRSMDMRSVRMVFSSVFDEAMRSMEIASYALPGEFKEDLRTLAKLMARLRVAYHVRKVYDEHGKPAGEDIEITQTDYPVRAYDQLTKFVIVNTCMRAWNRIVGVPEVDLHAMRLAAKLAISSTTLRFMKIMHSIVSSIDAISERGGALPSVVELSQMSGIPRTSLRRYLNVLELVGILYSVEENKEKAWFVSDEYLPVLVRYFSKPNRKEDGGVNG